MRRANYVYRLSIHLGIISSSPFFSEKPINAIFTLVQFELPIIIKLFFAVFFSPEFLIEYSVRTSHILCGTRAFGHICCVCVCKKLLVIISWIFAGRFYAQYMLQRARKKILFDFQRSNGRPAFRWIELMSSELADAQKKRERMED